MCREGAWGLRFDVKKGGSFAFAGLLFLYGRTDYEGGRGMAYIALYRKWRPGTFHDLVGQDAISRTLASAIASGRIGHAYLFSGPRGTGKTSTAKILAKSLNCEHGPTAEPCGACEACRRIADGSSMDVFEIDAASNRGIDEIRDLREKVKFAPVDGRYKVYIIDEVHMLTAEAFNALLKTLEEPPAHVVFILATTEAHKVPATIQSRCQRFDFRRITVEEIRGRLAYVAKESGIEAEEEALALIAVQADGGMRDALSILDQCSAVAGGRVTADGVSRVLGLIGHAWIFRMTRAIAAGRSQEVLTELAALVQGGKDLKQVLVELSLHLRSLMIFQAAGTVGEMDLYAETEEVLKEQGTLFSEGQLMRMIRCLHEALAALKWSPQPRITVEVALLRLAQGKLDEDGWKGGANAANAGREAAAESPASPVGAAGTGRAASPAADGARLAALEAKVAALSAALEGRGAKARRAAPKAALPAFMQRPAARETAAAPALPVTADGKAVFAKLLKALESNAPAHACFKNATFSGMGTSTLSLGFGSSIMASMAMHYQAEVEAILLDLTGQEMRLACTGEDRPMPPPPKKEQKAAPRTAKKPAKKTIDLASLAPEERAPLERAVDILGGTVELVEEETPPHEVAEVDAHQDVPPPDDPPPEEAEREEEFPDS